MLLLCSLLRPAPILFFFFLNDTATTEIYTLSLHDALPISARQGLPRATCSRPAAGSAISDATDRPRADTDEWSGPSDRKSTRLNSSHLVISYAVFCLKKKKNGVTQYVRPCTTAHCGQSLCS